MKHLFVSLGAACGLLLCASAAEAQTMPPLSCAGALTFPGGASACRDYVGSAWNPGTAGSDCTSIPGASGGALVVGQSCSTASAVGVCRVAAGAPSETALWFYGGDVSALENACGGFLQGAWSTGATVGRCDHFAATAPNAPPIAACKTYTGKNWSVAQGESDCSRLSGSNFTAGVPCGASTVGYCTLGAGTPGEYQVHYYAGTAAALKAGCEGFGGGVWKSPAPQQDKSLLPEVYAALQSDAAVTVSPNGCDAACLNALVGSKGAITFTPTGVTPTEGFIYLPGGTVDPRAYAVAARQIAAAGFFVAIMPFPGGIAIADPFRPNALIATQPEIEHWAIGGHSLGGVTASLYADVDPLNRIEALAIFAGYPPLDNDLSDDSDLRVYSFLGTEDDGMDMAEWEQAKARLPANTYYGIMNGANHEQFGYYTGQAGDGQPQISRKHQHSLYVGATIHMLRHLGISAAETFERSIYATLGDHENVCAEAQAEIAGFKHKDLNASGVATREHDTMLAFRGDHPGFSSDGTHRVDVISYSAQTSNPDDITAPPIFHGEVWCKMKSQAAIASEYALTPKHEEGSCAAVNQEIFYEAYATVLHHEISSFTNWRALDELLKFAGRVLSCNAPEFGADLPTATGPEFIESQISLVETANNDAVLTSPKLTTPLVVPPPFGGVFYCKLWTHEAAVKYIEGMLYGF